MRRSVAVDLDFLFLPFVRRAAGKSNAARSAA